MKRPTGNTRLLSREFSLGERIRDLRKEKGLKQSWVALRSQMSPAQLCHIEQAKGQPSLRTLQRLADALEVTLDILLGEAGGRPAKTENGDLLSSDGLDAGDRRGNGDPLLVGVPDAVRGQTDSGGAPRAWNGTHPPCDPVTGMAYVHDPVESNFDEKNKLRMKREIEKHEALSSRAGTARIPLFVPLSYPAATGSGTLLARELRAAAGIGAAGIVDPVCFFEGKGVPVIEIPLPSERDSWSLWDWEGERPFVFLQSRMTPERKRFRTAYEMGHVIRYVSGGFRPIPDIKGSRLISRSFAAAFLLPEEAVRETACRLAVGREDWTWELLVYAKGLFGVSAEAFLHRIEELRLITDSLKKSLLKKLEEHYAACRHAGKADFEPQLARPQGSGRFYELQLRADAAGGNAIPIVADMQNTASFRTGRAAVPIRRKRGA